MSPQKIIPQNQARKGRASVMELLIEHVQQAVNRLIRALEIGVWYGAARRISPIMTRVGSRSIR